MFSITRLYRTRPCNWSVHPVDARVSIRHVGKQEFIYFFIILFFLGNDRAMEKLLPLWHQHTWIARTHIARRVKLDGQSHTYAHTLLYVRKPYRQCYARSAPWKYGLQRSPRTDDRNGMDLKAVITFGIDAFHRIVWCHTEEKITNLARDVDLRARGTHVQNCSSDFFPK